VEGAPYRDVASRSEEPLKHETLHLGEGPARLEGEASTWSCSASARYIVCSEHRYSPSSRTDRPRNVQRPNRSRTRGRPLWRGPAPRPGTGDQRAPLKVLDNAAVQTEIPDQPDRVVMGIETHDVARYPASSLVSQPSRPTSGPRYVLSMSPPDRRSTSVRR
jgi:hypothetical protein